jgi:hypothetical protein
LVLPCLVSDRIYFVDVSDKRTPRIKKVRDMLATNAAVPSRASFDLALLSRVRRTGSRFANRVSPCRGRRILMARPGVRRAKEKKE